MALRSRETLPGVQVWKSYTTDATDRLDVAAAAARVSSSVFAIATACGKEIHLASTPASTPSSIHAAPVLDPKGLEALKRLQQRAEHAETDFWALRWSADAAAWEECFKGSFAAGMSLHLEDSTAQYQVVYEYRVALLVGRCLVYPADSVGLAASLRRIIQFRKADGSIADLEVDLVFPGTERSVVRLMQCWWDAKGGRPSSKEAKVAHAAAKPSSRALPTRFRVNHMMLLYWQEKLLTALVDIHQLMLQNKAKRVSNWFHPSSMTFGGRYSNTSACSRAIQAAYGVLACDWHDKTGGRQAECFRWLWTCTGIDGVAQDCAPPVWALGLAGVLGSFQDAQGTGYYMVNWHCKNGFDFGDRDYVPVMPRCTSGICSAAIINLARHVLTFLQPVSPAQPIVQTMKGQQPVQTLNNVRGFVFPYGQLKHLPALDDTTNKAVSNSDMARIVNAAISSASFIDKCWSGTRAIGSNDQSAGMAAVKYNDPSQYSKRYTLAAEAFLMLQQLGSNTLPADFWNWYMRRAGRSEASNSYQSYIKAHTSAYGNRLPYIQESNRTAQAVTFRRNMLSWSPSKGNQDVTISLSEQQQAALQQACEMAQQFAANPATSVMWEHLIKLVKESGSFAGMLQQVAGPLTHQYLLPAFQPGADLDWLHMTPAEALAHSNRLLLRIAAANTVLFGPLPQAPAKPVLFQSIIDVLCCDVDRIKLSLAEPTAQAAAHMGSATAAVLSAIQSAAAVAQATAQGDDTAAGVAAAAAAEAARVAVQHAQQLQHLDAGHVAAAAAAASQALAGQDNMVEAAPAGIVRAPAAAADDDVLAGTQSPDMHLEAVASSKAVPAEVSCSPARDSLGLALAEANLAAQLAAGPQQQLLGRGAGLLVLLGNEWAGRAQLLQAGQAVVDGQRFTHVAVMQLMAMDGLLLKQGQAQLVQVRIAAEYMPVRAPLTGHWSKKAFTASITPGVNLLLHSQAGHVWGKKFTASCSAAASSYMALYPSLHNANIKAALGRLNYEPSRPVRACVAQSLAVQEQQVDAALSQQIGTTELPAVLGQHCATAITAITDLSMALNSAEADAACVAAVSAVAPLLRQAASSGDSNMQAITSSIKAGIKQLHAAASSGTSLPAGVLQPLLRDVRSLGAVSQPGAIATESSQTKRGTTTSVATPAAATGAADRNGVLGLVSGSDAAGQAPAASTSKARRPSKLLSSDRSSKKAKQAVLQRAPPEWADSRQGCWLMGDWFVQVGDVVFMQVAGRDVKDPASFHVGSQSGDVAEGSAACWMFRVEGICSNGSSMMACFYHNKQQSLKEPLCLSSKAERLQVSKCQGIVHTMAPECEGEVIRQLKAVEVAELEALLLQEPDSMSEDC